MSGEKTLAAAIAAILLAGTVGAIAGQETRGEPVGTPIFTGSTPDPDSIVYIAALGNYDTTYLLKSDGSAEGFVGSVVPKNRHLFKIWRKKIIVDNTFYHLIRLSPLSNPSKYITYSSSKGVHLSESSNFDNEFKWAEFSLASGLATLPERRMIVYAGSVDTTLSFDDLNSELQGNSVLVNPSEEKAEYQTTVIWKIPELSLILNVTVLDMCVIDFL